MTVVLLARADSGETFFTHDEASDRYYVHHRYRLGDPVETSKSSIDRIVARECLEFIDREFDDWVSLADFIDETTPRLTIEQTAALVNAQTANLALTQMEKWLDSGQDDQRALALALATRYLQAADVQANALLVPQLADVIRRAQVVPARVSQRPLPRLEQVWRFYARPAAA